MTRHQQQALVDTFFMLMGVMVALAAFGLGPTSSASKNAPDWVVGPPGGGGTNLLLARAASLKQEKFIGNQAGGRVFFLPQTDDFWRDYNAMIALEINFFRERKNETYGTVAVFEDLYGYLWDQFEPV